MPFILAYWKYIAGALVIVALFFMVNAYNSAIERAAALEVQITALESSVEARRASESDLKEKLRVLAGEKEIILESRAAAIKQIKEIKDEAARNWLDSTVPIPVLDVLREGSNSN